MMKFLLLLLTFLVPSLAFPQDTKQDSRQDTTKKAEQKAQQDNESLLPDSLLNWLRIIELEGNRLIYAAENDESFFAVSQDRDGDLYVAYYPKGEVPESAKEIVSATDPETGESVADYSRTKINVKTAKVTYRSTRTVGIANYATEVTVAIDTGRVVPLQKNPPKRIRIKYEFETEDKTTTLIDAQITLPKTETRPK